MLADAVAATQLIGRLTRPEEIANASAYLASAEAAFITGSTMWIDGGAVSM